MLGASYNRSPWSSRFGRKDRLKRSLKSVNAFHKLETYYHGKILIQNTRDIHLPKAIVRKMLKLGKDKELDDFRERMDKATGVHQYDNFLADFGDAWWKGEISPRSFKYNTYEPDEELIETLRVERDEIVKRYSDGIPPKMLLTSYNGFYKDPRREALNKDIREEFIWKGF